MVPNKLMQLVVGHRIVDDLDSKPFQIERGIYNKSKSGFEIGFQSKDELKTLSLLIIFWFLLAIFDLFSIKFVHFWSFLIKKSKMIVLTSIY